MNIVVIGLGSMGKRRIRLLKQYVENQVDQGGEWNIVGVDSREDRRKEVGKQFNIGVFDSLQEACSNFEPEAAVICTAPLTHAQLIKECLQQSLHVFTEINLIDDGYEENIALSKEKNKILFLSSTPQYRKEIQYIKALVGKELFRGTYHYHIGQYLPDWHPWESYKDFFVASKRTNACREIFAIELPWMIDVFGEVKAVHSVHKKVSQLDLDYDDVYQVILEHSSGIIGNLTVDVITPKAGRELEIWGGAFYVEWKGTPQSLKVYDSSTKTLVPTALYDSVQQVEGYNQFVVENAYYDEIVNYIAVIKRKAVPLYSFEKDKKILSLIDQIEA